MRPLALVVGLLTFSGESVVTQSNAPAHGPTRAPASQAAISKGTHAGPALTPAPASKKDPPHPSGAAEPQTPATPPAPTTPAPASDTAARLEALRKRVAAVVATMPKTRPRVAAPRPRIEVRWPEAKDGGRLTLTWLPPEDRVFVLWPR